MAREYRLISADGHVVEPPDMWTKYLPKKFHDRAPKLVKDAKGGDAWELVPGTPRCRSASSPTPGRFGKRYEDLEWFGSTYDSILQGSFVGKARVEEQDFDGVDAEVLFPSQRTMGAFMAQEDDDYHLAGLEAYNTWMHDEFMAADPERLIGLAQMPGVDVQTSVKWLRDAKAAGYKGVIISAYPSGNSDLSAEDDAFWEAAEEEQMPVHIHTGLRQAGKRTAGSFQKAAASAGPRDRPGRDGRPRRATPRGSCPSSSTRASTTASPTSRWWRWSAARAGCRTSSSTWTTTTGATGPGRGRRSRCSRAEYFRRNWKVTFIREPFAVAVRHWIGVDNLMWSTDYPTTATTGPTAAASWRSRWAASPTPSGGAWCCDNARELYRLG